MKKYYIHNFKNHADTTLQFGKLTLLTGMNGAGKSSVIQSMLALRETFIRNEKMDNLVLKSDSVSLGSSSDVFNQNGIDHQDYLHLAITNDEDKEYDFRYAYPLTKATSMKAIGKTNYPLDELKSIALMTDGFQYLSAFRNGPLTLYPSDTDVVDEHRQLSQKNGQGEFVVYFLNHFGSEELAIPDLAYDDEVSLTLREQTECWLNVISKGLVMKIDQDGMTYKLMYGYKIKGKTNRFFPATNNGFGITYILSVIVAILSAKPGSLLLIENPEAHIHPSGQSALMELAARAAANGVQIIMETHSDHVVNGALVACKKNVLNCCDLSVYYFDKDENYNAQAQKIEVGENGRLQNTPKGFFDQMDADLDVLFEM